jgi:cobaltochelatase CobN
VRLRRKPNSEKRIAIVLNNPPCKMIEATVAVALGLDALETTVRLLRKLSELGYRVEGIPSSGQELAEMILSRRAMAEFRWTTPEETVRRGGALDIVPMEKYMEWFNELPEEKRREMIRWWGDPRRPRGVLAGAMYNGGFVVPGLRFGNVVVMPQPKFGCAGAACDGTVCRILHNPRVPPPHQWLAVYRWVTRVFDADAIIHMGTHGSLEFRPGKRVGLSPLCWPEITIDDKPFIYIYAVSNPMEAVAAKRRAYAVIVDHIHPAMELPTRILEEVEEALEEYREAVGAGDEARAKKAAERMRRLAEREGIPVNPRLPDEIYAEELHRFLERTRTTMAENGLHVFGEPPRGADLAKTVVAFMRDNTVSWPSIIEVTEEYLERVGACRRPCPERAAEAAARALERLLERRVSPDALTMDQLEEALAEAAGASLARGEAA